MTCPNCGWYVRGGARFCPNCGAELPSAEPSRPCPFCGAKLEGEVSLCPNCGAALDGRAAGAGAEEGVVATASAPPAAAEAPAPAAEAAPEAKRKQGAARVCPSCKTELKGKVGICPVCGEWLAAEPAPRPTPTRKLKPLSPQWPFDAPSPSEKKPKAGGASKPAEEKAKSPATTPATGAASQAGRAARSDAAPAPGGKVERSARAEAARTPARPAEDKAPVPPQPAPARPAEGKAPAPPQPASARPAEGPRSEFRVAPSADHAPEPKPWYVLRSGEEEGGGLRAAREARRPRPPAARPGASEVPQLVKTVRDLLPWLGLLLGIVLLSVVLFGLISGGLSLPHLSLGGGRATATLAATSPSPALSAAEAADVTPTPAASATPTATRAPSATPTPRTHVVLAGESLGAIAQQYGVTLADLMAANGIQDANKVTAGQELKIPDAAAATPALPAATPAATPTLTPAASPTASPVPSITPSAFEFPAPNLLTPADGEVFRGADDILLNWSSVGLLGDDTWYVVKIWSEDPTQPTPATGWTRTTAWRIPGSSRPAANAASHKMFWTVTVMRAREGQEPVAVSPASATRSFEWQ